MAQTLLILSDVHYASDAEKTRSNFEARAVANRFQRWALKKYRHYIWMRDPFAHNHLLDQVLAHPAPADRVIANGDYSCDSAFIGVADAAARQSALECLTKLRERFPGRFLATIGDHELGKRSMAGGNGGLRFASWKIATEQLGLEPFWKHDLGRYVLIGVASSPIALPVYQPEILAEEAADWNSVRAAHLKKIREGFDQVDPAQKILLFCHDPSALPFLWREEPVRKRLPQVERTVVGHLHTNLVFQQTRLLSGIPTIRCCGNAVRRMSTALSEARLWRPFRVLLCPALAGCELLKDGGYYTATLDPSGRKPAEFTLHKLRR